MKNVINVEFDKFKKRKNNNFINLKFRISFLFYLSGHFCSFPPILGNFILETLLFFIIIFYF